MLTVGHDSTVLEVHTIFVHPFFGLLVLPMVTPLIPFLNDTCLLSCIAECTKRVTFIQCVVELSRDTIVGDAVGKLFHLVECLP